MKTTVSRYDFERAFFDAGRKEQFSYEAMGLLFDYFEQYEQDTGEEIELDVIAICCEYSEDTLEDIANNYWDRDSVPDDEDELRDQVREYLEANTSIVGETPTGFVYACF
jgi:hypothetical protein